MEIGSEFEFPQTEAIPPSQPNLSEYMLTYSGRTAIQVVLDDILKEKPISKVWMPSYCCRSMIQPFEDKQIPVQFYSVSFDENCGVLRSAFEATENDVVVTMSYFGFTDSGNAHLISSCVDKEILVIEDCTHSFLRSDDFFLADYRVVSLRKWLPVACGGAAQKRNGIIEHKSLLPDPRLISARIEAMKEKAIYLQNSGPAADKEAFLIKYRSFNNSLSFSYQSIGIDPWSEKVLRQQDLTAIKKQRYANAELLYEGLSGLSTIHPLFTTLNENDVPLFVPIITTAQKELQKWLAEQNIYCPIHWPRPSDQTASALYATELSLICDQRYGEADMQRIVCALQQFERVN